jgi:hypothetical protein
VTRTTIGPFSLDAPKGWGLKTVVFSGAVEANPTEGMLVAKQPVLFEQNLVITVERVRLGETAKAYLARQQEKLKKQNVQRTEVVPVAEVALKNGGKGVLGEYTLAGGPSGERLRQLQLVTIKKDLACTLIATHLDGPVFEDARDEMRAFMLSFD